MANYEMMQFDTQSLINLPTSTQRALQRGSNEIIKEVYLATLREQGRAYLTNTALQNVGALSALEEHLNKVAPTGSARYKFLADAYALGAGKQIEDF